MIYLYMKSGHPNFSSEYELLFKLIRVLLIHLVLSLYLINNRDIKIMQK